MTWLIVAVAFVAVFTVSNHEAVTLNLFPLPFTVDSSLSIITLSAFMLGALVGGFIVSFRTLSSRLNLRKANKKIKQLQARNAISTASAAVPDGQFPLPLRFQ